MTTNQVLIGVGLILALAVGSQVLASRLKIPALIILLPVGFTAGAITTDVNPQDLLGAAFQPLVSLAVAVILYDSGMSLNLRKLHGHVRRIVVRLIVMGVPAPWCCSARGADGGTTCSGSACPFLDEVAQREERGLGGPGGQGHDLVPGALRPAQHVRAGIGQA
jgi:hypothetical protein